LEPADRRDHAEQQRELRMLDDARLDEKRRSARVQADGEPVDEHVPDGVGNTLRRFVVGRQRVPVCGKVQALVFLLQTKPVLERAVVVADMHPAGRAHARQNAIGEHQDLIIGNGYKPTIACSNRKTMTTNGSMIRPRILVASSTMTTMNP